MLVTYIRQVLGLNLRKFLGYHYIPHPFQNYQHHYAIKATFQILYDSSLILSFEAAKPELLTVLKLRAFNKMLQLFWAV
jgi:hypothetical protein